MKANVANLRPVVLCGGAGTRLWPASRDAMPKQFSDLFGERTTFQMALQRAAELGRPLVMTNSEHRYLAARQMAEVGIEGDILLEPVRRDSGPAVVAACLAIEQEDPEALALVLPADHVVRDEDAFLNAVTRGLPAAGAGRLVLFGVKPAAAETSYGYIEPGARIARGMWAVSSFKEKPCEADAERYVRRGMFWNSGNFLFRVGALIEEYRRFEPMAAVEAAVRERVRSGVAAVLGPSYENAVARSLDHAVMERTERAAVAELSCGWSDVGSWDALWGLGLRDEKGNVTKGEVALVDTGDCYVASCGPLVSVVGQRDLVVVCTEDAVLVADRRAPAAVKDLVGLLRDRGQQQADVCADAQRPWGSYRVTDRGDGFQVKRITVSPGGRLSLQRHRHRAEHWVVVSGEATVTVGDLVRTVRPSEHVHVPRGAVHRLENFGDGPLTLIEVQTGSYLGEDDIERLEDIYERV